SDSRAVAAEIAAPALAEHKGLAAQDRVAVLRPAGPASAGRIVALPGRAEQPILPDREDALLEPDEVRLERRHVGEEERDPLRPAIGDVAQVEGRDAERNAGRGIGRVRGHGLSHERLARPRPASEPRYQARPRSGS